MFIHYFLIFALKHRLWVQVRTASLRNEAVLSCTHNLFLGENKKNTTIFHPKIIIFKAVKNHSILHRRVFVIFTDKNSQKGKRKTLVSDLQDFCASIFSAKTLLLKFSAAIKLHMALTITIWLRI